MMMPLIVSPVLEVGYYKRRESVEKEIQRNNSTELAAVISTTLTRLRARR